MIFSETHNFEYLDCVGFTFCSFAGPVRRCALPVRQRWGLRWREEWLWTAWLLQGWGDLSCWDECFSSRPRGNQPCARMRPPAGSHLEWCQTSPEIHTEGADIVKLLLEKAWKRLELHENPASTCLGGHTLLYKVITKQITEEQK